MRTTAISFLLLFISSTIFSQIDPVDKAGVAIGGYDVVAYFNAGKATPGTPQFATQFKGTTYHFSNKENQTLFETTPEKYLPQYEGFCALAVSYGKKISVDPKTFKVIDGKLYLFFNGKTSIRHVNSLDTWNKNEPKLLKKADELWPDVKKKVYKSESAL